MRIFKHPIKKLTLLAAFGGGYVLGAKAGRERYEQIKQTAQQVKDDPRVQQATAQAEDLVREAATKVTEDPRVKDVVSRAEDVLRDAGLKTPEQTGVHPLLADEHYESQDEVVYSSGPDIEETIDELADTQLDEQPFAEGPDVDGPVGGERRGDA
ncbi:hypothetical protein [Aeromicrobium stalagmiti]|uniref:hypothetical protein n=1 Tax=Aeromicrobium stalagmiti TaxID=2738988 RepID=UPI001569790E|nr:hypothetical protein [Aeromicrobium stalagmiti]NRQ50427.1 hypothetical protein [Aeromicrobium stalagmiti]